jgi:hypothetical protein
VRAGEGDGKREGGREDPGVLAHLQEVEMQCEEVSVSAPHDPLATALDVLNADQILHRVPGEAS